MRFSELGLPGAWLVEFEPARDNRGHFARTFCQREFEARGLEHKFPQHSTSFSRTAGTLRGMHFQKAPHGEVKVVRCIRGAIHDVIVDLRRASSTFGKWVAVELSATAERQLYIPAGFAHGFQILQPDTEVTYLISAEYVATASAGIRYDDPRLAIRWPLPVTEISQRDVALPSFDGEPID